MTTDMDKDNSQFIHHDQGYGTLSLYQQNVLKVIQAYVTHATRSLKEELQNDSAFTVVDYGAADGVNSVPMIAECSAKLQESTGGPADWVDLQFVDGNFYHQVVPDSSVNLGVCSSSIHWLSSRPPAGCNLDVQKLDQVTKKIVAQDWLHFLQCRAKELRAGGRLVVLTHVIKEEDIGDKKLILTAPYHVITNMFNDGTITKEEYESARVAPLTFGTTEADLRAPFQDPHSELGLTLQLVKVKTYDIQEPFSPHWMRAEGRRSEVYVQAIVNLLKSYSNSYWKVLDTTRTEAARRHILQQFYTKLEEFVRENPDTHHFNMSVSVLDIEKRA